MHIVRDTVKVKEKTNKKPAGPKNNDEFGRSLGEERKSNLAASSYKFAHNDGIMPPIHRIIIPRKNNIHEKILKNHKQILMTIQLLILNMLPNLINYTVHSNILNHSRINQK